MKGTTLLDLTDPEVVKRMTASGLIALLPIEVYANLLGIDLNAPRKAFDKRAWQEAEMKDITPNGFRCGTRITCRPSIFKSDDGTYIIAGKIVDPSLYDGLLDRAGADEGVIEVPVSMIDNAVLRPLGRDGCGDCIYMRKNGADLECHINPPPWATVNDDDWCSKCVTNPMEKK